MEEEISLEYWLGNLAQLTGADFAACARWHNREPHRSATARFGTGEPFNSGWLNWAEHLMEKSQEDKPEFLRHDDDFADERPPYPLASKIQPHEVIMLPMDWHPTRVLIVLRKIDGQENWNARANKTLRLLNPYFRELIKLRNLYDRTKLLASTTCHILDTSPRGVMAVAPDGRIRYTNAYSEKVLEKQDGISRQNLFLTLHDQGLQKELVRRLEEIKLCPLAQLGEQDWDIAVPKPSGQVAYQFMLRAIPLRDWKIEASPADRIASIFILDPEKYVVPSYQQLQNFYNLTTAEAKLAAILYSGVSTVNAAEQLQVSVNTVKTHLRKIFPKLGVKNQAELLGKLTKTLKYGQGNQR